MAALAIYREIGDRQREAITLNNVGNAYYELSQYPQALENIKAALAIFRKNGDRPEEANSLRNLGLVYYFTNQNSQALEHLNASLAIYLEIGDHQNEKKSLSIWSMTVCVNNRRLLDILKDPWRESIFRLLQCEDEVNI